MTRQQQFLSEAVEAAKGLVAEGGQDITWVAVAERRVAPAAVSDGDIGSVMAIRRPIRRALMDAGHAVVPVNGTYWERTADPTTPEQARRMLPVIPHGGEVGFRVCADSTDLLWQSWQQEQAAKFGGGLVSMGQQVLAQGARDGQAGIAGGMVIAALKRTTDNLAQPMREVTGGTPRLTVK